MPVAMVGGDAGAVRDLAGPASDLPPAATGIAGTWKEPGANHFLTFVSDGTDFVKSGDSVFASGTWSVAGNRLTFVNTKGACATPSEKTGVYDIAVTSATLAFKLVNDVCPRRNVIDGETWTRVE